MLLFLLIAGIYWCHSIEVIWPSLIPCFATKYGKEVKVSYRLYMPGDIFIMDHFLALMAFELHFDC